MDYQKSRSHLVLMAIATLALPACGGSDPAAPQTSGGLPTDSGGASGVGGSTGTVGATSAVGTTGNGNAGPAGSTGADATSGAVTTTTGAVDTTGAFGTPGTAGTTTGTVGNTGTTGGTGGNTTTGGDSGATDGSGTTGGGMMDSAPSAGCGSPAGLDSGRASIDVSGTMREYVLRVPDNYDPNQPYRLIFGWHQLAGSAEFIANFGYYGVEEPSAGQAILVAPEGLIVNERNDRGWANNGGEDMDFYHAMLDRFFSELCVDQNRIFSTGFSYGAMWSFNLACTPDSMTRAVAPQAGSAFGGCNNTEPVATLAFVGTDDSLLSGHRQAVDAFVESNSCSQPVEMSPSWCDGLGSNNQPCSCMEYQDCLEGYPVISCEYKGGHLFAPNSGETIWEFFSQF